ncbi:recombinase family protein [Mesorhizobium sp. LSHC420B00]|uniref:recombinase family protein n=2 Tax=unclassified Mesorhizobium TaxID=325217 RepID=UPI0032AFEA65
MSAARRTPMKRAALYARYSSDLQTDRSIEDQVALCSDYAAKQQLTVATVFHDRARSGASIMGRDGVLSMMDAARDGLFDVPIVEALDRLSRDQEDLAGIYKRLTHLGIEIRAVHDGRADIVQIGIRGLVGALYLQDLAQKVRRGMAGVVRDGRSAGGKACGYAPVPGKLGELSILPEEAAIVLRIFEEYAAGRTPRDIAGGLNDDNIAPPRGRYWSGGTINGNPKRGYGILQNAIYDSRIVWNRVHMVKDPDSGRRQSRVNPKSEWQEHAAEHLRIVPAELFAAVNNRKPRNRCETPQRKNTRLLSGLLRCGACGSGMSVKDKMGRLTRIVCTRAKESRSCTNTRPYAVDHIEATVLDGLRARLNDKALIDHYVAAYNDEHQKLYSGQGASREKAAQRLDAAKREYDRVLNAYVKGMISEAEAEQRLPELRAERQRLEGELAVTPQPPKVVTLKPALVTRYIRDLEALAAAIGDNGFVSEEAKKIVRDVVTTVTVYPPKAGEQPSILIDGYLSNMVDQGLSHRVSVRGGAMVAGEGLEPPTPGL